MSTGVIATAMILIVGDVIVSKFIGFAFRLVIPLVLLVVLTGAGVLSDLVTERSPANQYTPYEQTQHRSSAHVGDLRLRDIADMAVDALRSMLQGSLALLNGISVPEPRREPRWPDEPQHTRNGEPYETPSDYRYEPRKGEPRQGW